MHRYLISRTFGIISLLSSLGAVAPDVLATDSLQNMAAAPRAGSLVQEALGGIYPDSTEFVSKDDAVRSPFPDYWKRQTSAKPDFHTAMGGAFEGLPVIDVMILYTSSAKAAYTLPVIDEKITLSIAYINEAFRRSGVNGRFRLVYKGETSWHAESCLAADELSWLSQDTQVSNLREQFGADLVSLLTLNSKPTGGLGQLPGVFSVYNGSPLLFAHECGHNLGCDHDRAHASCLRENSESCAFGYSFTVPNTGDLYGDIMSYVGSQIEQFSNPNRYFLDVPTGLPAGHVNSAGVPDAAAAVEILNQNIPYASAGRAPQIMLLNAPALRTGGTQFGFQITGPQTGPYSVEMTTNHEQWTTLTNGFLSWDGVEVVDFGAFSASHRLYRVQFCDHTIANEVGYIKKEIPPGFSMMANPFETDDNSVGSLLSDVPEGTQLYKWMEGQQAWNVNTFTFGSWAQPAMTLHPGEGVVIRNSRPTPFTLSFCGEVNQAMHSRLPLHDSIRSSAVPLSGGLTSVLNLRPFGPGAQVFKMKAPDGKFEAYTWDGDLWTPSEPILEIGEAFWCRNLVNAFVWERVLWKE